MGNPTGFVEFQRVDAGYRPVEERIKDFREVSSPLELNVLQQQAARCMDCGVPFCHSNGCPLENRIPEFNEAVYRGNWREAAMNNLSTNNFPEITGRVCPAPCETSCTLTYIRSGAVNICHIEYQLAERAFAEGWVQPLRPTRRSGKSVAVIGSGPAGLAASQQLNRMGHEAVLFERDDRMGGLLRYGIPDFKMEKWVIDRRMEQMAAEGVVFEPNVNVGVDVTGHYLQRSFDAICLCMGAGKPRMLNVPGADLDGVHLALDFLMQQNRRVAGDLENTFPLPPVNARDKHVVVIGGGDTGSDCVGTSVRQGAKSVHQLEIMPKPPEGYNETTPWPAWPMILRTSSSHLEGCERRWSTLTKELRGKDGKVEELIACEVEWEKTEKGWKMQEKPGTEFSLQADLVILAMGFLHVDPTGLVEEFSLDLDPRGNIITKETMTSVPGVFAAGDAQRGASLVVHAINDGRKAAEAIHRYLATK